MYQSKPLVSRIPNLGAKRRATAASRRSTSGRCGASGGSRRSSSPASCGGLRAAAGLAQTRRPGRTAPGAGRDRATARAAGAESLRPAGRCRTARSPRLAMTTGLSGSTPARPQRAAAAAKFLAATSHAGEAKVRVGARQAAVDRGGESRRRSAHGRGSTQHEAEPQVRLRVRGILAQDVASARSSAAPVQLARGDAARCAPPARADPSDRAAAAAGRRASRCVAERLQPRARFAVRSWTVRFRPRGGSPAASPGKSRRPAARDRGARVAAQSARLRVSPGSRRQVEQLRLRRGDVLPLALPHRPQRAQPKSSSGANDSA